MEDIDGSFLENCVVTEHTTYSQILQNHRPSTSEVLAPYENQTEEENIFLDLFNPNIKGSLPHCDLSSYINKEKYENIEYFNSYITSQEMLVDSDILEPAGNDEVVETLLSFLDFNGNRNELENHDIKSEEFNISQSQENYKNNNYLTDRSDVGFQEEENNFNENINTKNQNELDLIIDHEEIIKGSNLSYNENNLGQFDNNYIEYSTNNNTDDNSQNIQIQNDHVEYIMHTNDEDNNLIETQTSNIQQQQQMQPNQINQLQQEQQKIELKSPATLEAVNANAENLNSTKDNNICNQIFVEDFNETDVLVPRTNESSSNHLKTADTNFKISSAKTIENIHDYDVIRCNPLKTKLDYKLQDTTVKSKKLQINDNTNDNQENNKNLLNDSSSINNKNTIDNSISQNNRICTSVSFSKKTKHKTNSKKIVDTETSEQFKNKLPLLLKLSSSMRNNKNYNVGGNKKKFDDNEMKNSNEKMPIDESTSDNIDYNIEKYSSNYILQAPIFEKDHDKNSIATNIDQTNDVNTTKYMSINSSASSYNSVVANEMSEQDQMLPELEMNINSKIQKICSKNFENGNTVTKLTENVQSLTLYQSVNNKNNSLVTSKISNTFSDDDDDDDVIVKNGKVSCEKCKKSFMNPKSLKIHNKQVCILPRIIEKKLSSTNNSLSFNNNDSNLNLSKRSSESFKSIEKVPSKIIDENIFERSKTSSLSCQPFDEYESDENFPVNILSSNNKQFPVKISSDNNNAPLKIIDENIQKNKENHAKIMNENNQNFENFSHLPIRKINQHNLHQSTSIKVSNQQSKNICLPNVSKFQNNHYYQNKNTNDNNIKKGIETIIPKITLSAPSEPPSSSNSARTSIAVTVDTNTDNADNVQSNTTSVENNSISPIKKIAKKTRKRRINELESLGSNIIINVSNDTECRRITRSQIKKKLQLKF